jgi:hypothetical protein
MGQEGSDMEVDRRLNRRQMIKAAGIAGAAAWTAPVIIDSLASPAAAASVPGTCYRVTIVGGTNCTGFVPGTAGTATCPTPAAWTNATPADAALISQLSTTACSRDSITAVLTHSSTCVFSTTGLASNTAGSGTCTDTSATVTSATSPTRSIAQLTGAGSGTTAYFLLICCT